MTKRWTLVFVSTFALALGACGEGQWPGPAAAPLNAGPGASQLYDADEVSEEVAPVGWAGDWFPCLTTDCSRVLDDGLRLGSDGMAYQLDAFGEGGSAAVEGLRYCVDRQLGSWSQAGSSLILGGQTIPVAHFAGNRGSLLMPLEGGPVLVNFVRVVTPKDTRSCKDDELPPIPGF